jgi:heme oxygenase (biliverdin-IX-beta and delta-forming)
MLAAAPPDNAVRVGDLSRCGLREKLKAATASAHRALDARFGAFDLTSMAGYRRFLEASASALLPIEAALERAGIADLFSDWPQRSRRTAIVADLDRIGGVIDPLPPVLPMNRHEMLGTMYVLEGSRLGAKYLMRAVTGCGEPRMVAATNYLAHGDGLPLWRTFLETLEREGVAPDGEVEVIAGAQRAFAMFARAAGA